MTTALLAVLMLAFPVPAKAQNPPLRIAVAGPTSGSKATLTAAIADGARAAEAAASVSGPLLFRRPLLPGPYEVTLKDDGCEATQAEETAKAIVADGFDLVLGHPCPKAALAAAKVYAAAGVIFIATETRHPDLTAPRAGPSIFRLCGRDDAQGLAAAHVLAMNRSSGTDTIAIVNDRTLFAKTIAEQAEAELKRHGIPVITGTVIAGDKEYAKLADKIKGAKRVFFAGFPLEAGFIVKSLRATGSTAPLLATDSIATDEFTSSFPEIAKESFVLLPSGQDSALAAATAVRLFLHAVSSAYGPFRDKAASRAATALNLAKLFSIAFQVEGVNLWDRMTIKPLHEIAFDANGNANIDSHALRRWTGEAFEPASSLPYDFTVRPGVEQK